jgi:outer membrane protein OmpA-like peptidoglycan-associated protein
MRLNKLSPAQWSCFLVMLCLSLAACRHAAPVAQTPPPVAAPPAAPHTLVVLLPDPEGKATGLTVTNAAGAQTLNVPYQAVTIDRGGAAPSAPFAFDQAAVRSAFGPLLDALPAREISFLLYFDLNNGSTLTAASQAMLADVLRAVRDRRSTAITVIGHTDTIGTPEANRQLGLLRAQTVSAILRAQGAAASDLLVESHGDADLLVPTERGRNEPRNRRVEIIVR